MLSFAESTLNLQPSLVKLTLLPSILPFSFLPPHSHIFLPLLNHHHHLHYHHHHHHHHHHHLHHLHLHLFRPFWYHHHQRPLHHHQQQLQMFIDHFPFC